METQFSSGEFTQTVKEHKHDQRRMKKLKSNLEKVIPGSNLMIEDACEWVHVWRIPYVLPMNEIRETHYKVIRGYGGELCAMEAFSDKNNSEYSKSST